MANIEHKSIPDGERHEPKGASTAAAGTTYVADGAGSGSWTRPEPKGAETASAKQVYISDGAGGGSWEYYPEGWGFYQHSGTGISVGTTAIQIPINGSGALTNEDHLPGEIRGSGSLWDTTSNTIDPIRVGDGYDVRIELPITAKASATELTVQFDIGGAASPSFVILNRFLSLAKTPPFTLSFGFPLVALSSTTVANGIQLFAFTDSGTVTITNPSILIKRDYDGAY